jgi:hypothetical protein
MAKFGDEEYSCFIQRLYFSWKRRDTLRNMAMFRIVNLELCAVNSVEKCLIISLHNCKWTSYSQTVMCVCVCVYVYDKNWVTFRNQPIVRYNFMLKDKHNLAVCGIPNSLA